MSIIKKIRDVAKFIDNLLTVNFIQFQINFRPNIIYA